MELIQRGTFEVWAPRGQDNSEPLGDDTTHSREVGSPLFKSRLGRCRSGRPKHAPSPAHPLTRSACPLARSDCDSKLAALGFYARVPYKRLRRALIVGSCSAKLINLDWRAATRWASERSWAPILRPL